jgi:hypothetical protein
MQVVDVGKDVPAQDSYNLADLFMLLGGGGLAEKFWDCWYPVPFGQLCNISSRLDTEHAKPSTLKSFEDRAVIAGNFDDQIGWPPAIPFRQTSGQPVSILPNGIRGAGNIDILTIQLFRWHNICELYQPAISACSHGQWERGLILELDRRGQEGVG